MAKSNTKKMQSQLKINSKISAPEAIELGIQAVEKGSRQEAHNIFEQTSKLHPDTSGVWVWLGGTSPDLESAEAAFEKAYALDPNNEEASLGLRWVRLKRKVSLADIVGATVPVPMSPVGVADAAPPIDVQQAPLPPATGVEDPGAEESVAAQMDETSSKGGMNMRLIIFAVIIAAVALGVIAALVLIPH